MTGRCGKCQNCRDLERVRSLVLACCNTIAAQTSAGAMIVRSSHVDDGVVQLWNTELARLPCLALEEGTECPSNLT